VKQKDKITIPILCILLLLLVGVNLKRITHSLAILLDTTPRVSIPKSNEYKKDYDFLFVKTSENYVPYSYEDLLNIIYSTLNNGWSSFTFYCPKEYVDCLKDLRKITSDNILLTHINNYVNPYNSIKGLDIITSELGEITLRPKRVYSEEDIKKIKAEINKINLSILEDDMDIEDQIREIHDYIIKKVKYDVERNDKGTSPYRSDSAYGPLFQGYATCDGYADLMAIFLSSLNLQNFRIATIENSDTAGHVWNAVLIKNKWLHIDLTWNDPISNTGEDILRHTYFLINDEELILADEGTIEINEHKYNPNIYLEFKNSN